MRNRRRSPTAEAAMYRFNGRKRRKMPARIAHTTTATSRMKHVHQTKNSIEPGTYPSTELRPGLSAQLKWLRSGRLISRATEAQELHRSSMATEVQVPHRSSRETEAQELHRSSMVMEAQELHRLP